MGGDQGRGCDVQGVCCQHEVGLVIREKFQNCRQDGQIGEVIAQHFRRQARQRQ